MVLKRTARPGLQSRSSPSGGLRASQAGPAGGETKSLPTSGPSARQQAGWPKGSMIWGCSKSLVPTLLPRAHGQVHVSARLLFAKCLSTSSSYETLCTLGWASLGDIARCQRGEKARTLREKEPGQPPRMGQIQMSANSCQSGLYGKEKPRDSSVSSTGLGMVSKALCVLTLSILTATLFYKGKPRQVKEHAPGYRASRCCRWDWTACSDS